VEPRPSSLGDIVERLGTPRVLVVGDLILDRYVWGNAERISQEAPVILLRADRREERLGGAASVAMMLSALGAEVILAGVLGDDATAERCRDLLDAHQVGHHTVLTDPHRPSTLKERYIGRAQQKHPQQMMRVDYEVRDPLEEPLAHLLITALAQEIASADVVLVSDYDKGVCTPTVLREVIAIARRHGKKVIVDPIRGGNYAERYRGCSSMTPNRLEAGLATGIEIHDVASAMVAAEHLCQTLDMEAGIVTLDRDGMALVHRDGRRQHFSVRQRDVYDITGAGDMVLAMLGMVLAAGFDYPEAIAIANSAGGLEVERIGVATVSRAEIIHDLKTADRTGREKLVSRELLVEQLQRHRQQGKSIVFTNGCFDILHGGHVGYLQEARAQGDLLIVGLNTDASVRRLGKGPDRPINDERQRAVVLGALECVDYICLFDEPTPLALIELIEPTVLVKGADYKPEDVVGREFVEARGGRLHLAELVPGRSTTRLVDQIRQNQSNQAA
jgi:D-beta-D-heptose 7-phosphate kinase / D-beta-D-heptose 1-phosphate adenosyltransferase